MRVLLCETDPVMLEATQALLESRGLSVTAVADVAELPPVTGYDVLLTNCQQILSKGIPTIYMSQSHEWCDEVSARGIPAIKKPFHLHDLIPLLEHSANLQSTR